MIQSILVYLLERWTGKLVIFASQKVGDLLDKREISRLRDNVVLTTKAYELEPNETNKKNLIDSARKLALTFEL